MISLKRDALASNGLILSRNSTTIRSAVFFPIPWTELIRLTLLSEIASDSSDTVNPLNTLNASLGPTPLTSINRRNISFSPG